MSQKIRLCYGVPFDETSDARHHSRPYAFFDREERSNTLIFKPGMGSASVKLAVPDGANTELRTRLFTNSGQQQRSFVFSLRGMTKPHETRYFPVLRADSHVNGSRGNTPLESSFP